MSIEGVVCIAIALIAAYFAFNIIVHSDLSKMNPNQYMFVKKENIKSFTKQTGSALLVLSLSFLITGILHFFIESYFNFTFIVIGAIIYVIILLNAQKKYNIDPNNSDEDKK